MATVVFLPVLVPDMPGGILTRWLAREGMTVAAGGPLAELSIDGRSVVMPSPIAGVLQRHLRGPGADVPIAGVFAIMAEPGEGVGFDRRQVECFRVRLLIDCLECGGTLPINGIARRTRCDHCKAIRTLSTAFWIDWVWRHLTERFVGRPDGTSSGVKIGGEHGSLSIGTMVVPPLCRQCRQLLISADTAAPGILHCSACGEPHQVRRPPDWLAAKVPKLLRLIGEDEPAIDDTPAAPPKPVVFHCPSCSASLSLDGGKRIVTCKYCEADVYLPEDLWAHFHPVRRRQPWWWLVAR